MNQRMLESIYCSLWISVPAVSEVVGIAGQQSVQLTEVIFGVSVVIPAQSTKFVLIAAHGKSLAS